MEILHNGKNIGYSHYLFSHKGDELKVKNITKFDVELFNVKVFSIDSQSTEIYFKNKLIKFFSETKQNKKVKFVDLFYDKNLDEFIIKGSSYSGSADKKNVIGNWWNHEILNTETQISPLSGSVKKQLINFIKEEKININDNNYELYHYKLISADTNLSDEKKLDFDIWYDPESYLIRKVTYKRMGKWDYILTNVE
ncbi:MAG: hypothetical protein CBD95_005775 [Flavobacteriales bacterium TMED235]|nr:MAG: hypothetical protein CBD95_005775 [Flavobacteriales bacterium TMED235]